MSKSQSLKTGVAAVAFIVAALAAAGSKAASVFEGSSYFTQVAGAFISGGPFSGVVFDPTPIGPGGSSIIIEHSEPIVINGGPAPFVLTAFAAHSAAPVVIGARAFNISLTLNSARLTPNGGTISIDGSATGGTFTATSDYYVNLTLTSVSGPPTTIVKLAHVTGSPIAPDTWSSTPPPGTFLVPGPLNNSAAALEANIHAGLPTAEFVDFFPTGDLTVADTSSLGGTTTLTIAATTVPEPAAWSLAFIGAVGVGGALRRRRTSRSPAGTEAVHDAAPG